MKENTKSGNVKWKTLKEICKISTGKLNANAKTENGKYPFFTCQKMPNKIDRYSFDTEAVLMAGNGNVGNVHYYSGKFDAYQGTYIIESSEANVKFLYYYLKTFFKEYVENYKKEGIISYITLPVLEKFLVPLPPLKKQEEIAAVLDKFTELTEELTEELTAREAQYDYYRNMLLSEDYLNKISEKFIEDKFVEWKMLGELFEFKNGLNKGKDFFGKGTPIINYLDVYKRNKIYLDDLLGLVETTEDEQKRYSIKRGDVFFTRTSETKEEIGKTSVLLDDVEKGVFSGFVLRARPITELLLPEYCAYCFET